MGNITSVGIDQVTPADTNITWNWSSFDSTGALSPAAGSANGYAVDPAGNKFLAAAAVNGRFSSYVATVTGLTPGTPYTCSCDADGVMSPNKPGTTTGSNYTAHLIPKGDGDGDGPDVEVRKGGECPIRVKVVKINDPNKTPLPGVTVYFAVTSGGQYGTLDAVSAVSNLNGIARIGFDAGNAKGDVQITATSPSAYNPGVVTAHVK